MSERGALADQTLAIIGAGPAGLTLARLLQMRGVNVHAYERDVSPHARDQGGTLDLHEDSGQLALIAAGLSDKLSNVFRPEGQAAAEPRMVPSAARDESAWVWPC